MTSQSARSSKSKSGRADGTHRSASSYRSYEQVDAVEEGNEDQQDSGLETRFTSGAAPSGAMKSRHIEDDVYSSSNALSSDSESEQDNDAAEHIANMLDGVEDPPDNSPYAQVRASVRATDDITLSINTPRMWIFSLMFALLGSSTNLFFSLRYPSVSITPIIALLLAHPLGLLWDEVFKRGDDPIEHFLEGTLQYRARRMSAAMHSTPAFPSGIADVSRRSRPDQKSSSWKRRFRLWLAQGRWNEKEHTCVYIASNVSFGFAFATDVCFGRQGSVRSLIGTHRS